MVLPKRRRFLWQIRIVFSAIKIAFMTTLWIFSILSHTFLAKISWKQDFLRQKLQRVNFLFFFTVVITTPFFWHFRRSLTIKVSKKMIIWKIQNIGVQARSGARHPYHQKLSHKIVQKRPKFAADDLFPRTCRMKS